jgi:adenylyltransferase and sulfurtransferase
LAGAGIGTLGIIDPDIVDSTNLHRQTIHREADSGHVNKVESAARFIRELNSSVKVETYCEVLDHANVINLISNYDVVVDASDNPKTRYLLSDACIISNKPLISGSAVGLEGQLTVYNYGENSPCYRCVYPNPPKSAASCADSGVVGMVPAIIGNLQGLEALKVIAGFGEVLSGELVMYDARCCSFHKFKVKRRQTCITCGIEPSIRSMEDSLLFSSTHNLRGLACAMDSSASAGLLDGSVTSSFQECSASEYHDKVRLRALPHVLLDVRDEVQYHMCNLSGSINIPLSELKERLEEVKSVRGEGLPIYVMCRRGINSKKATQLLCDNHFENVFNVRGGLTSWSKEVDHEFPLY